MPPAFQPELAANSWWILQRDDLSPQPDTGEVLAGLVERVTYRNAENGFCVLRAGRADIVKL